MRNFYHTLKFSSLTINSTEVPLRQILDLGKHLIWWYVIKMFLKTSLQDVLKISWRRLEEVLKTSWRCLEENFARRLVKSVLKMFWRSMAKTNILVLIKTSWRRLQDIFWRSMTEANIFILIKTSWRRLLNTMTKDVFKTSSSRRMFSGTYPWGQKKTNDNIGPNL